MKFYIAAKYNRRLHDDVKLLRKRLEEQGHECTAQWLDNGEEEKATLRQAAEMDVADVYRADCLIFIGQPEGSENTGGGRWFELGIAWAAGKRILALLDTEPGSAAPAHESVFTALPKVRIFTSSDALLGYCEAVREQEQHSMSKAAAADTARMAADNYQVDAPVATVYTGR